MDIDKFTQEVETIEWCSYKTAYGNAKEIPDNILKLLDPDLEIALEATNKLWSSLCHQKAFISSAAEPAYPLLRDAFLETTPEIQIELLDIFDGFAECSSSDNIEGNNYFYRKIRDLMYSDIEIFENYSGSEDSELLAQSIVDALKIKIA